MEETVILRQTSGIIIIVAAIIAKVLPTAAIVSAAVVTYVQCYFRTSCKTKGKCDQSHLEFTNRDDSLH